MSELTPYLCVVDARAAIDFCVEVLGAEVVRDPIGHRWFLARSLGADHD